jgi:tripartite-type tricarboxylate transporter receptor subunit TctC
MKPPHRRQFLHLAVGVVALPAIARAQTYPARPVRIVVGFPAGGSNDLYAGLIEQFLSERLGQQFIVENRTGAGGSITSSASSSSSSPSGNTPATRSPSASPSASFGDANGAPKVSVTGRSNSRSDSRVALTRTRELLTSAVARTVPHLGQVIGE